ncbi:hypothetical protein F5878DRAFT_205080 [Lentinula raphanica]|uniref:Uncharacterized protein n=1 Tax=Lentinula raphanica TaxID=153919 RepID=A0AA38P785_9AGAR|nr:hypothetical protein F5878DRAFT_205080 [Lentinula raphanica]
MHLPIIFVISIAASAVCALPLDNVYSGTSIISSANGGERPEVLTLEVLYSRAESFKGSSSTGNHQSASDTHESCGHDPLKGAQCQSCPAWPFPRNLPEPSPERREHETFVLPYRHCNSHDQSAQVDCSQAVDVPLDLNVRHWIQMFMSEFLRALAKAGMVVHKGIEVTMDPEDHYPHNLDYLMDHGKLTVTILDVPDLGELQLTITFDPKVRGEGTISILQVSTGHVIFGTVRFRLPSPNTRVAIFICL